MRIGIFVNPYKDHLTSEQVRNAIIDGIKKAYKKKLKSVDIIYTEVADGGDGTLDTLSKHPEYKVIRCLAHNPLNELIECRYLIKGDTAIIEMAEISGLRILRGNRVPLECGTYGVGEIINDAIMKGSKKIYIGLGGSSTSDFGIGMAISLGIKFFNSKNNVIHKNLKEFLDLDKIDFSEKDRSIQNVEFIGLCDSDFITCGKNGVWSWSGQKGASLKDKLIIREAIKNINRVVYKNIDKNIGYIRGGGSAGGLGSGIIAFLNGKLERGTDYIFKELDIEEKIKHVDLVITAEGNFDYQSTKGKATGEIIKFANKYDKQCVMFCGKKSKNWNTKNIDVSKLKIIETDINMYNLKYIKENKLGENFISTTSYKYFTKLNISNTNRFKK